MLFFWSENGGKMSEDPTVILIDFLTLNQTALCNAKLMFVVTNPQIHQLTLQACGCFQPLACCFWFYGLELIGEQILFLFANTLPMLYQARMMTHNCTHMIYGWILVFWLILYISVLKLIHFRVYFLEFCVSSVKCPSEAELLGSPQPTASKPGVFYLEERGKWHITDVHTRDNVTLFNKPLPL